MILGYINLSKRNLFFFYKLVIVKPQPLVYERTLIQLTCSIHSKFARLWTIILYRLKNYLVLLWMFFINGKIFGSYVFCTPNVKSLTIGKWAWYELLRRLDSGPRHADLSVRNCFKLLLWKQKGSLKIKQFIIQWLGRELTSVWPNPISKH